MKPKHTKGPWYCEKLTSESSYPEQWVISSIAKNDPMDIVIHTGNYGTKYNEETQKADAHLIAAAPEMLEALENALAWIDRSHKYGSNMESSRLSCLLDASGILSDAIKKARGES